MTQNEARKRAERNDLRPSQGIGWAFLIATAAFVLLVGCFLTLAAGLLIAVLALILKLIWP